MQPTSQRTHPVMLCPSSLIILTIPRVSATAFVMATSSASAELNVMLACVVDHPLMKCSPMVTTPPLVLFPVFRHPAQSLPVYVSMSASTPCHGYVMTVRCAPSKYPVTRFSCFHAPT